MFVPSVLRFIWPVDIHLVCNRDIQGLITYGGWQNVNYVLNDIENPVRALNIAGP